MGLFTTAGAPGKTGARGRRSASGALGDEAELAQFVPDAGAKVVPAEGEGDVGGEEPELRAAVVGVAVKLHAMELLLAGELNHSIGQLDFAAGALVDQFQDLEDFRLQDVASGYDEVGRGRSPLRLLDHAGDLKG